MKRKLIKGLELLIMAGFLVTTVGRTVHATENKIDDNIVSDSGQKQDESGEKSEDTKDVNSAGKESGSDNSKSENYTSDEKDTNSSGTDKNVKSDGEETVDMDQKDSNTDTSNENTDDKDNVSLEGSKDEVYTKDTEKDKVTDTDNESDLVKYDEDKKSDSGVDVENSDTDVSFTDKTDEETVEAVETTEVLEETLTEETVAETETVPKETIPVETRAAIETLAKEEVKKTKYLTMEDIEGLWSIDDSTSYRFSKNGTGALVLPEHSYSFDYKLDEDILEIDFVKKNLRDSTFRISLIDGVMNLQCLDEYFENEYELRRD